MYASTAGITFRNPFDSTTHLHNPLWSQPNSRPSRELYTPARPPTPPPEMQSSRHESSIDSYSRYSTQDNQYPQQEKVCRSPVNRAAEPATEPAKQSNVIAPSFQIPKTVNDSGGSLSELAAQITCFFWFESPELLDKIESTALPIQPSTQLTKDAIPTTGFRKWVTTILSTTLVGANVVLLALLFIHRLKKLNPSVRGKAGSEYRLLTVALMLGNKFLDDNTYTNKTWAEVSGIMVSEVHVMEVEFLSNMKYCLYTSSEDWMAWQALLGRYAAYVERASHPVQQRPHIPAPILQPASSLRVPMALPSPPGSTQASPPYAIEGYPSNTPNGPTPAPSPLALLPVGGSRKRSLDDRSYEPVSKRLQQATPDSSFNSTSSFTGQRPTLPMPVSASNELPYPPLPTTFQQLPPLTVPARAMSMVYTNNNNNNNTPTTMSLPPAKTQTMPPPQHLAQNRQLSPYTPASAASPAHDLQPGMHHLHHGQDLSPSVFLKQRSSPYRPVHNVSTLLYPPPSAALQQRRANIDQHQMHYQPLSKAAPLQSGHLPYISQHPWTENQQLNPAMIQQWQAPASYQRHPLSHPGV